MELDVLAEWAMFVVGGAIGLAVVIGMLCASVWMVVQTWRTLRDWEPSK